MADKKTWTGGAASTPRSKNFTAGECVGMLTAATTNCAAYRGSRTGDKKRRSGAFLLEAFVNATLATDRRLELTRTADSINKKIKNMRSRYMDTCQGLKSTGISTAKREALLIKFGGAELYDPAREAFKASHASTQLTVREPEDLSAAEPTVAGEKGSTAVVPPRPGAGSVVRPVGSGNAGGDGADEAEEDGGPGSDGGSVGSDGVVHVESGAESAPETAHRDGGAGSTATAADIAAAASPAKKAKRDTAVGLFRECISQKMRPAAVGEAGGTTDSDVRQALVNMINAYADKARRG
ncbi:hypothetical protein I4F81_007857 [Pyropia yezoensis]|uniref:Uncharacterized protein n=1 Tax=Pyropia yezoensis TaxID=2788 RepID=A0ACC3C4R9_PYRYE|nr:hypothetical protein I4F81_007857 [Neopyropia yezoensis]